MDFPAHDPGGGLEGALVGAGEVGVLVLAGSSGRVDVARARLLARHGAVALALRWFGAQGQPPGICEVPLETLSAGVDRLVARGARRIGIVGLSKGAEAALLLACRDPRVKTVVAISPSSVAWANVGPGRDGQARPARSCWTWRGEPLPFVPYDDSWRPAGPEPVSYRSLYERSLQCFPEARVAAAIPVEHAPCDLLLVAGGDDELWPSALFAEELTSRRRSAGRQVELVVDPAAGHRPILPGEPPASPSSTLAHGGSIEADERLGLAAWPPTLELLGLAG